MLRSIIALAFISLTIKVAAQSPIKSETICGVFKSLHFKNGLDTIQIKARFVDLNPLVSEGYLDQLNKEKGVNKKNFYYQLSFEPENCSKQYLAPCSDRNINKILKTNHSGAAIKLSLTIVVFEKYSYDTDGTPYFVVIKTLSETP